MALNATEIERLFGHIARIKAEGTAVVYISHRLPEVRRIADRISVLRDGEMQGCFPAKGATEAEILALIIGRQFEAAFPEKTGFDQTRAPILRVKGMVRTSSSRGALVIHGVQHVMHPPRHMPLPDAGDLRPSLVFITQGVTKEAVEASVRHHLAQRREAA